MSVGEDAARRRLNHQIHRLDRGYTQRSDAGGLTNPAVLLLRIVTFDALVALRHLPQLYRLVVGRQQEVRLILALEPSNFVDFLFDLERFQVVEFGLVRLEGAVDVELAAAGI